MSCWITCAWPLDDLRTNWCICRSDSLRPLWERPLEFLIDSSQNNFSLCGEGIELRVLIELDRGDCLIFARPPRNLTLDSVSRVHQDLPHAVERRSGLLRIVGDRPVTRYEDVGVERLHCIQHPNPRNA